MRISYSSFETYNNCPLKYKFQEIDKIRTPKSKEAVFGSVIHGTMKFIHTPGILSPTMEQAMEHFSNSWNPAVFDSEQEERSAFAQGVRIIQDYYKRNNIEDFNIVNLESRFAIEIGGEGDKHVVSGIIDRIDRTDEGFEIIDYKTGKKMPTQKDIDENVQLTVYLQAFLSQYPEEAQNLEKLKVSLYFLKHGVKLSATRTKEQLKANEQMFLETIKLIEEGKFEPNITPLCDWCGYQRNCPMWKHKFKEERKIDTEEVNASIQEYIDLKSAMTITKERLGKLQEDIMLYMEQEEVERVFGENGIVSKTLRKTYKYDDLRIKELLEPIGKWKDVLKLDPTALKSIFPVLPGAIQREIEKAKVIDKETKSLGVRKK